MNITAITGEDWQLRTQVFANIFAFTDAPNKRRAAKLVSRWLTIKHAAELVLLPLVVPLGDENGCFFWSIGC